MTNESDPMNRCREYTPTRRRFLEWFSGGITAVAGVAMSIPVFGFVFAPLLRKPLELWRPVGKVDGFDVGTTVLVSFTNAGARPWAGVADQTAAWLRRVEGETFIAFALNCTHLGCPVRWEPKANMFMCPCHGGVYYEDGDVAGGPPPKPLPRYAVRVRDGQVEIQTAPVPIT